MTAPKHPRIFYPAAIAAFVVLLAACAGQAETDDPGYSIIVYGSDSCSICVALRGEMDEADLTYEYHDIRVDDEAYAEAVEKISDESWFDGTVRTPVLEINGEMYERPTIAQVRRSIQNN